MLIEFESPTTCFALVSIFQCTCLAILWLDVAGLKRRSILLLQAVGSVPCFLAIIAVSMAPRAQLHGLSRGEILADYQFRYASAPFFFVVVWLEGLLQLAWPSKDMATLPRRFRTVLFLDVFALADDAVNGVENMDSKVADKIPAAGRQDLNLSVEQAKAADAVIFMAEAALRRWEAVPAGRSPMQEAEVKRLRKRVTVWSKALLGEAMHRAQRLGDKDALELLVLDERPWQDLTEQEKRDDPHAGKLLGPFTHDSQGTYYYNLERGEFLWEAAMSNVLTLQQVSAMTSKAEEEVSALLSASSTVRVVSSDEDDSEESSTAAADVSRRPISKAEDSIYAVQRLPWRVLVLVTRVLQLCWLASGVSFLIEDATGAQVMTGPDALLGPMSSTPTPQRRLNAWATWDGLSALREDAEEVPVVAWPRGAFGAPFALSCLPGGLMISGTEEPFWAAWPVGPPRSTSLPQLEFSSASLPPGPRVAFCGAVDAPCFLAAPWTGGNGPEIAIALWELSLDLGAPLGPENVPEPALFALDGSWARPWLLITGGTVLCNEVRHWLLDETHTSSWCLLLAGWDGARLPVAVVPLQAGRLPRRGLVSPAFAIRLPGSAQRKCEASSSCSHWTRSEISAIHLDSARYSLLALQDGRLHTWDLLRPGRVKTLQPALPAAWGTWRASGLCVRQSVAEESELVVVGSSSRGPRLLRTLLRFEQPSLLQ